MKTKKITALLCALTVAACASVSASAAANTDWPQFLGSTEHAGVTSAQTPVAAAETQLAWSIASSHTEGYVSSNLGTPIVAGDYVYVTDKTGKLLKLNAKTGAVAAQAAITSLPAYFSYPAYGDGKIFVPQETAGGVTISAFNADTLAFVWKSGEITVPGGTAGIASPILYANQHIYFGTYVLDLNTYQYTSGSYVCLDTGSGAAAWQNINPSAGYYWNGGAVAGSAVAVADSAGTLHTFNLQSGAPVDTVSVGGAVGSTPAYTDGTLYVSVKTGSVFAIKADANGNLEDASARHSAKLGNKIISSPVVYNGRLYVAGGGDDASPFSVLNASTLAVIYQIAGIHSQSTPLITTAYATGANHQQVLIYAADAGTSDENYNPLAGSSRVYVIKDSTVQTAPSFETLFTPGAFQFCSQSLVPSKGGMLYYYNDGGTLFALGKKAAPQDQGTNSVSSPQNSSSGISSAAPALGSPKTGDAPAASAAVLMALSGAVLLFLHKKSKR